MVGETRKTVWVRVNDDFIAEGDESFGLHIASGTAGVAVAQASAAAIIHDNEPPPVVLHHGTAGYDVYDMGNVGLRSGSFVREANGDASFIHGGVTDTFSGIEVVKFADGKMVFDPGSANAQVVRLYQAALGRAPDQGGQNYWAYQVEHGASLTSLAQGFAGSTEFEIRYGANVSNPDYVDLLYQNALGRTAEPGGRAFWLSQMDGAGVSRADVMIQFSESSENIARTAGLLQTGIWDINENAAFVARLYDTTLGRLPDVGGLRTWTMQLDSGLLTHQSIVAGFTSSPEFAARYGAAVDTSAFVDLLYHNTLHRDADAAGRAGWVQAINSGSASRADVVLGFSESTEHQRQVEPYILNEDPRHFGILFA